MDNIKETVVVPNSVMPVTYSNDEPIGYKHVINCTVCSSKDRQGKPLRDTVDKMALTESAGQIAEFLNYEGVKITANAVLNHLKRHAPYVKYHRDLGSKKIQKMIVRIKQTGTEVSQALQRIVDMGDSMVQAGQMPVTEKLYIEALKEQGRRGVKTSLDTEFETMDQDFIKKIKEKGNE
jgi:hypothetical protein